MFDVFRSQRKSVKYVLAFIMGMVGLSMVITMVPGLFSTPTADLSNPVLVEVGDERITIRDVQFQLSRMIPPGQDASQIYGLMAGQAIDSLVSERVMLTEADRLGLKPNERQLAEWIRDQLPTLFPGGQFDGRQYAAMVQQRFSMTVPDFEQQLLLDLTVRTRLQSMITDSVVVTEDDVRAAFTERNEQARIEFVVVSSDAFRDEVDVSDERVQEFFDSNRFRYQTRETRGAKLITFVSAPPTDNIEISEGEIRAFYDQNRYRFETQDRVRPRHILFMTINPDTGTALSEPDKAAKKELAEDVLAKLRAGGDFAELAAEHSEDPGTQGQGGDLGWVARGQMGTPAFEDPTFALQTGEMSEVVETEFGFHIIEMQEREAASRQPFEDVREEIIDDLRFERNQTAEQTRVDQSLAALRNASPETVDGIAAGLGFEVQTFSNFEQSRAPSQLSRLPTVLNAVFSGALGELVPHADAEGMIAVMVTDIAPIRDLTYEEAGGRTRADYLSAEIRTLAEARAVEVLERAKSSSLAEAAAEFGLEVTESDPFNRAGFVPGFANGQVLSTAFTATPGELQGPIAATGGFGLYRTVAVEDADMAAFVAQRTSVREQLTQSRRAEAFSIFEDEVLTRYEESGQIRRYEGRIQQFIGLASRPLL